GGEDTRRGREGPVTGEHPGTPTGPRLSPRAGSFSCAGRHSSSPGDRRACFLADCRRLSATRRRFAALPGLDVLRGFGSTTAARTISASFASQSSRLRSWSRVAWDEITTSPSTVNRLGKRAFIRSHAGSGIGAADAAAFHRSTAFEDTLFTFCPPGPPERA